jgi:ABC-type polysaccharide/polyol phosphate export permease
LWQYRALLRNLVVRDVRLRYRNSVFGFLWSLLNPLLMMGVFTMLFVVLLHTKPANNVPFPLFVLTGLLAWNYLATSVGGGLGSIVNGAGLISKVSFPREILPIAIVLANAVNFLLALVVLIPVILIFGIAPSGAWLIFPVIFLGQTLFVLGVVMFLAAVNVYFRDTEVIMEVGILAWFFLTPIFYDITQVFPEWHGYDLPRLVRIINPMASYITSYRDIFLQSAMPDLLFLTRSILTGFVVAIVGYAVFLRLARGFGDVL